MVRTVEQLATEIQGLKVAGVENRMFFGEREICQDVFRNRVRMDLLRRWIHFADFPAPFLPRGRSKSRVTTWGLVEAWLLVLTESSEVSTVDKLLDESRSFRQRRRAIELLKKLHSGDEIDDAIKQVKGAAETKVNESIRIAVRQYEESLKREAKKVVQEDQDLYHFRKSGARGKRAIKVKGIRPRPIHAGTKSGS